MTAAADNTAKGYGIGLAAGLVDQKHMNQMGMAIWLYMWLILRVTKNKDGLGKVLGGKPITLADVQVDYPELTKPTYNRYVTVLRSFGYITTTRAPYGLIVCVTKTKKTFYAEEKRSIKNDTSLPPDVSKMIQPDVSNVAHLDIKNDTSNKDRVEDRVITPSPIFVELAAIIQPKAKPLTYAKQLAKALKLLTAEELIAAARYFAQQFHGGSDWHSRPENQHFCTLAQFFGNTKDGIARYALCAEKAADALPVQIAPARSAAEKAAAKAEQLKRLHANTAKLQGSTL